jgi:hypothetical protein
MPEDDHIVDYRDTAYSPQLRERGRPSMKRASDPDHEYSPNSVSDRARERWRLDAPRWAAAIALATLLTATTVHAFVIAPRELAFMTDDGGLPPEVRADLERQLRAMMVFPCHEQPGDSELPIASSGDVGRTAVD